MKKLSSVWKLVFILLIFTLAFTSCRKNKECQHVDANDDSLCDKCSASYTDGQDVFEEHICVPEQREENRIEATCEKEGSYDIVEFCSQCNKELSRNTIIIDMLAHTESEWIVDSAPSCLKSGFGHKECTECGITISEKTISALGHNYKVTSQTEPTCTDDGQITFTCQRSGCGATKQQIAYATGHSFGDDNTCDYCQYTESIEHTHNYITTVFAPTCTEMGYTLYECGCGDKYRDAFIDQKGHSWDDGVVSTEATCTLDGIMLYSCLACSATYEIEIQASHNWTENVISSADCTKDGVAEKVCTKCDAKEGVVISASHIWGSITVIKQSTCSENGIERRNCARCNYTAEFEIKTLGHKYVNGKCTICGGEFIESVTPRPDHLEYGMYFEIDEIISNYGPDYINEYGVLLDYNESANIEKVAVYLTQDGTMWRRCIACVGTGIEYATYVPYLSYYDDIKYTGLNSSWINIFPLKENSSGIWCYNNYTTIGVNLEDKYGNLLLSLYDIGQAGTKTRVFDNLNEMIAWLLSDCDDHVAGDWIIDSNPTCTTNGSRHTECTTCGETITTETLLATGHNYVDGHCANCGEQDPSAQEHQHSWSNWTPAENLTEIPVCEYEPVYTRTCYSCGQFEMETWPAPGHHFVNGYCDICFKEDPDSAHTHNWSEWEEAEDLTGTPDCIRDRIFTRGCSSCGQIDQKVEPAPGHNYVDGYCGVCGGIDSDYDFGYSVGLEYTSNGDGTCYVSGIGTCKDNHIVIPSISPQGLTVTSISDNAFSNCNTPISFELPESIMSVGQYAFHNENIQYNVYGNGKYLGTKNNPYYALVGVIDYTLSGDSLHSNTIVIAGSVSALRLSLTSLVIPNEVINVGSYAYCYCSNISNLVIGNSVNNIENGAFYNCSDLINVYYSGTEEEWETIIIGINNESLINATRYYYSETQPTTEGNFWHYVDGVPTVWDSYDEPEHVHNFGEWIVVSSPDCVNDGYEERYCDCGEVEVEFPSALGHDYVNGRCTVCLEYEPHDHVYCEWIVVSPSCTSNGYQVRYCFCGISESETILATGHIFVSGRCTACNELDPNYNHGFSLGLEYTSNGDGTCYVSGIGTCEDTKVIIPETSPAGLTVTGIGYSAFYECTWIEYIHIPSSVTNIGSMAFSDCTSLVEITIPEGPTNLDSVFSHCTALKKVVLPDSLERLDMCTFMCCSALEEVVIGPNSSLYMISQDVFYECTSLTSIFIPKSVTMIIHTPFNSCTALATVYYGGSESDWNNIYFQLDVYDTLNKATRYYYSETQPTTEGNFWHYVDGEPTIW